LTDSDEHKAFRVFPIGPLVSFSRPEAQLDKAGLLHVLFQTGARSFLFCVINSSGEVIIRQTYDYAATRPVLRATEEGRIFVGGGVRRVTAADIPAPLPGGTEATSSNPPVAANPAGEVRNDRNARTPGK
jgi:hypothetical protein